MELCEALGILNIDNIYTLDESKLKEVYRKAIRKNHPDLGGTDEKAALLNNARDIIVEAMTKLKTANIDQKARTCILGFKTYMDILDGQTAKVMIDKKEVSLNKGNIGDYYVYLDINVDIIVDGVEYKHNEFLTRVSNNEYEVQCNVKTMWYEDEKSIIVMAYGKTVPVTIRSDYTRLKLTYPYADLALLIIKQIVR